MKKKKLFAIILNALTLLNFLVGGLLGFILIKGEDLKKEFLISSKFNSAKNLKSLNKKQFILNWNLCMRGLSDEWKRL